MKIQTSNSKSAIITELGVEPRNLENGTILLDESYFPWIVAGFLRPGVVVLSPGRKMDEIRYPELFTEYDLAINDAYLYRLVDLISTRESHDFKVGPCVVWNKSILTGNKQRDSEFLRQIQEDNNLRLEDCKFQDNLGIWWGPFSLSPMKDPMPWPFPGEVSGKKNIFLVPCYSGYIVTDKIMQVKVNNPFEGINFAIELAKRDWSETVHIFSKLIPINITPYQEMENVSTNIMPGDDKC
jgi:hypothetical protein